MAQLPAFQYCTDEPLFVQCTVEQRQWLTFSGQPLELSLVLVHVACCMAIMKFWPKTPKIGKWIPASLVALLVGTLIEWTLFRMAIGQGTRDSNVCCAHNFLLLLRAYVTFFLRILLGGRDGSNCRRSTKV
jgi:MFS superfamily sulfate permease-like transporter